MPMLDEAIFERDESRENSLERNLFGDGLDSDKEGDKRDDEENKEKLDSRKVVKKRISTQPRLNPERLCGPRGIIDIENHFKGIQFKGHDHEAEDLNNIMKHIEIWAHQLFPKYTFDDCLFQIERLGKKKQVHNYMHKYRLGELNESKENDQVINSDGSDNEEENVQPFDEMDEMIAEQLSKTTNKFSHNNSTFDELGVRPLNVTNNSQSFGSKNGFASLQNSQSSQPNWSKQVQDDTGNSQLTDEQKKRMAENRLKALERLKHRKLASTTATNETNITFSSNKVSITDPQPSTSYANFDTHFNNWPTAMDMDINEKTPPIIEVLEE